MKKSRFTDSQIIDALKRVEAGLTMWAASLAAPLKSHLKEVKAVHEAGLARGRGEVWLPHALAVEYPNAPRPWGWQYIFPATGFSVGSVGG